MSTQSSARNDGIDTARERIADCFEGRDSSGRLVQRRDALNLAGLGLTVGEVEGRFTVEERGLGEIGFEDLLHLRYLDLTGNQLERLPRGMGRFARLQWLGLNFNRIRSLSGGVGDWPELRCLYLRGNSLRTLPEKAAGWGKLVELDLFGNEPLVSLPPGLVRHFLGMVSDKESGYVVLGKTALWDRMQKAGLKGKAEVSSTPEMLEWIGKQEHLPETWMDEDPYHDFDVVHWLGERMEGAGSLRIAQALARLGLDDREWLPMIEDPALLPRRVWKPEELRSVEAALEVEGSSVEKPGLWEAWYAAGLELAVEAERSAAGLDPAAGSDEGRAVKRDDVTVKAVGRKGAR